MARKRVAILISGRGSNMAALIAAAKDKNYPAEIALVVSNQPDAAGLALAREAGIEAVAIDHRPFRGDRVAHEAAIQAALTASRVEIVCLAGYLRLLTTFIVGEWKGRMLNIHPSLLPAFPGLHTHARALAAGVMLHGCTVHLVTEQMDEGPILVQEVAAVTHRDSVEDLIRKGRDLETVVLARAVRAHLEHKTLVFGNKTVVFD